MAAIKIRKGMGLGLVLLIMLCSSAGASVISHSRQGNAVRFRLDKGSMEIVIQAADIVEVKYSLLSPMPSFRSLVVPPVREPQTQIPFTVYVSGGAVFIRTGRLIIRVDSADESVSYRDLSGHIILAEDRQGKQMSDTTVAGFPTFSCKTRFISPAGEGLYGLGCHPLDSGSINYKGREQDLAIRYMTGAIPVLLSTRGFGLFWDNYSASRFMGDLDQDRRFGYFSESGRMVDYYFFYGPQFDRIIASYRTLTGEAPLFPKWAFGLFQSQDRYTSQPEILRVKDRYRENHIPLDCIVQDWFYWAPFPIGSHIMNPTNYPDPRAMLEQLHQAHVHGMISIWPCFGYGSADDEALEQAHGLTNIRWSDVMTHGLDTYYDPYNPAARELYWGQARDSLIRKDGWDAWWADQCEPDDGDSILARKQNRFWLGPGIDYFNTYSLEHTTAIYDGWRKDIPDKRVFILARQAFAGQQRNAAALWSSDIPCTFSSLRDQVPQGINACASGIPYWTSDIGGYHYHWAAPDWSAPPNQELFIRWFQFGAFCPVFRIHGKGERALYSSNWSEETKKILLSFDNLRYRLIPYIYSLSWKVTREGYTPMRALAFDFREDTAVRNIPDEYMFGPAFLVSPVTTDSARTRTVYLPSGGSWVDFWTAERFRGGQQLTAGASLDILPLYIRQGSILPMGPFIQYATEDPGAPMEIRIYPGADGQFTLYEDENDGYGYEQGRWATISLSWNDHLHRLAISSRKGQYPGMPAHQEFRIILVKPGRGTGIGMTSDPDRVVRYEGKKLQVILK